MKIPYDPEVDALTIRFADADAQIVESEEVRPGVVFDFDAQGRIGGVEILDASDHLAAGVDVQRLTAA